LVGKPLPLQTYWSEILLSNSENMKVPFEYEGIT
jgi:hypothetical protein